jgi:CspA family cold shock protein
MVELRGIRPRRFGPYINERLSMSQTIKIIISLVIAAVVASATTLLQGKPLPDLPLMLAFCIATVSTVLLTSLAPSAGTDKISGSKPQAAPVPAGKEAEDRESGKVKWFNVSKGFGFIVKDDGEEIFVHFRSIRGEGRRSLRDGQRVSFHVADSEKGPQAEDVVGED